VTVPTDESDEPAGEGRSSGVLAGLLAPLRLPERVLEALDELRPMRVELTRVRKQTASLGELLPALQRLQDVLGARIDAVHDVVDELRTLPAELVRVREQTELLPGLQRLQDVLGARIDAVHSVVEDLRPMPAELVRVREQTELQPSLQRLEEVLGDRLEALHDVVVALEGDDSHLNRTTKEMGEKVTVLSAALTPVDERLVTIERCVETLAVEVKTIHETVDGIKGDIQRITGLRGDRGVVERARDALTGSNDEQGK
jgi:chromosome segregation ATPase